MNQPSNVKETPAMEVLKDSINGSDGNPKHMPPLLIEDEFPGYVVELFRSLRTKVLLSLYEQENNSVGITSLESGAGKTTVSVNLALMMAQRNIKTLLIDGDMRRGELHDLLGMRERPGLTEFLESRRPVNEENVLPLIQGRSDSNFRFISSGRKIPHSSELLSENAFRTLMKALEKTFDVVVLDLPPLGMAVDPAVVQDVVGKYVFVAQAASTNMVDLSKKIEEYPAVSEKSLGIVLNKASIDRKLSYYRNSKYYSIDEDGKNGKRAKKHKRSRSKSEKQQKRNEKKEAKEAAKASL